MKLSKKFVLGSLGSVTLLTGFLIVTFRFLRFRDPEARIRREIRNTEFHQLEDLAVLQSKLESGLYTSRIFRKANNAFGMKMPRVRPTLATGTLEGEEGTFAKFDTVNDSARDLVLWYRYTNFPVWVVDVHEYVKQLKQRGYFELDAADYERGMKSYL